MTLIVVAGRAPREGRAVFLRGIRVRFRDVPLVAVRILQVQGLGQGMLLWSRVVDKEG